MYGNRGFGGQRGFAPVKVGEEVDVKIEAVGEKGDGIAKEKGFVLFVPSTKAGDEVRIKITKVLRNVGFAEVVGKASGPIDTSKEESAPEEDASEEPSESVSEENSDEEAPQDSEDFGEESEEPAGDTEDSGEEETEEEKKE